MNFLTIWKDKKAQRLQNIKDRIVKNEEVILEAMGKRAKGVKTCPFYLGANCIADACEFFLKFVNINYEAKQKTEYYQCAFAKIPLLLIELREEISKLVYIFTKVEAEDKKEK